MIVADAIDDRHLRVYGEGSLFDEILRGIGVVNATNPSTSSRWTTNEAGSALVPLQRLADVASASLLLVGPLKPDVRVALRSSALWRALPATRERRVAVLPVIAPSGGLVSMQRFATAVDHSARYDRNGERRPCLTLRCSTVPPAPRDWRFVLVGTLLALAAGLAAMNLHTALDGASFWSALAAPDMNDMRDVLVRDSLVPRIAVTLLCGAALGLAGTLVQQVLRNPLAEPMTLGIFPGAYLALMIAGIWMPGWLAAGRETIALARRCARDACGLCARGGAGDVVAWRHSLPGWS